MINRKLLFILFVLVVNCTAVQAQNQDGYNKKAIKKERKADQQFARQQFDKAMLSYEGIFKSTLQTDQAARLHLKIARLYLSLLDYPQAIPHFDQAMLYNKTLFNLSDVSSYLDALRYSGQKIKAISVAMQYAYSDVYRTDQRFQNILHALNYEGGFMPLGIPEYSIRKAWGKSSENSEFWIGNIQGEIFYAESNSPFHDPGKRFYHRVFYRHLHDSSFPRYEKSGKFKNNRLSTIPVYLQNGPIAFSSDGTKIIVTGISYEQGEQVKMQQNGLSVFPTRLYYSEYNTKRNGWSSFKEAIPQKVGASYSHPHIFNGDRSILFSSDMEGGYGGYDLYLAHWDDNSGAWGEPINLGPDINTEGDEISPSLFEDLLVFSSNGHVGFGGFDLYSIQLHNGKVVKGSLHHFDYPINTAMNDFGMLRIDQDRGYIVSDRLRVDKDDIFYFERNHSFDRSPLMLGMDENRAISSGVLSFSNGEDVTRVTRNMALPAFIYTELQLSLFFDFDRYNITEESLMQLHAWLKTIDQSKIQTLIIDGYADEMGSEMYNLHLSQKRAYAVSGWLASQGVNLKMEVAGKGQLFLEQNNEKQDLIYQENIFQDLIFNKRVWQNKEARKVDIKAIIKQ